MNCCNVCIIQCASPGGPRPLHIFAHGDLAGGPIALVYDLYLGEIVSRGFTVLEYLSCGWDQVCQNGEASFLEVNLLRPPTHSTPFSTAAATLFSPQFLRPPPRKITGAEGRGLCAKPTQHDARPRPNRPDEEFFGIGTQHRGACGADAGGCEGFSAVSCQRA